MRVHKPDLMTALCWIAAAGVLLSSWTQAHAAEGDGFAAQLNAGRAGFSVAATRGLVGTIGPVPIPLLTAGVSVNHAGGVMAQFGFFTQPSIAMHERANNPDTQADDVIRPKIFPATAMLRLVKQF